MKIKTFIKNTAYVIVTILSICLVAMTMLTALAAEASESTALEREQARIQWIAEHGEYQPNLTESAKQEAMAYTNINQRQSKQDDKDFFIFLDLKQMFGVHHATAMTAVCRGELPQPKTLIINGSRVKGFQFDDVNNFFEIIRGVSNGKPTSTMGTQNVQ